MLKHEEQAREAHGGAIDFRAATTRFGKVIGWTFHVPRNLSEGNENDGYSWVDCDGDAPVDTFISRRQAEVVLRSYRKAKKQAPVNELEKRA